MPSETKQPTGNKPVGRTTSTTTETAKYSTEAPRHPQHSSGEYRWRGEDLSSARARRLDRDAVQPSSRLDKLNPLWERLWWSDPDAVREDWEAGERHLNEVRLRLYHANPLHWPEKGACSVCGFQSAHRDRGFRAGDLDPDRAAKHVRHFVEALNYAWMPLPHEVLP
jgi:hypothetical protein